MPSPLPNLFFPDSPLLARTVRDYRPEDFRSALGSIPPGTAYPDAIVCLCRHFLERPYLVSPLGGGPGQEETFRAHLRGFDCVTFFETAISLAQSRQESAFLTRLLGLRYRENRLDYACRRHYMTHWREENILGARCAPLLQAPPERRWHRVVNALACFGPQDLTISGWPKKEFRRWSPFVQNGDVVFFISARERLDYFHTGVLARSGEEIELYHASRSRGAVVRVPLPVFLANNRMSGVTISRPLPFPVENM